MRAAEEQFAPTLRHDDATERAALGSVLLNEALWADVAAITSAGDYYRPAHRYIYQAMSDLAGRGEPIDAITVRQQLEQAGRLEQAGGAPYLTSLTDGVPKSDRAPIYLERVRDMAATRRYAKAGEQLTRAACNGARLEDLQQIARNMERLAPDAGGAGLTELDLSTKPEPLRWLVRGVLPEGGRCVLAAPSNRNKSWVSEDLALAVASGTNWLGLEEFSISNNGGPVLLVDEESPAGGLHHRLSRLAAGHGWNLRDSEWRDRLAVYSQQGVTVDTWGGLVAEVRKRKACMVVLDPAVSFLNGSDCDPADVSKFFRCVKELQREGAAVMIVHHAGWTEKDRSRGWSGWRDQTDVELNLAEAGARNRRKLTWRKVRDGAYPDPVVLEFDFHPCAVRIFSQGVAKANLPHDDKKRQIVEYAERLGGPVRTSDIVKKFKPSISQSTIYRLLDELKEAEEMEDSGRGFVSVTHGKT